MKHLFMQKNALGPAKVWSEEVPVPQCGSGSVLLANRHSLISAGTESTAVRGTKRDMVVKTLTSPDLRQSVVEMVLDGGLQKTSDRVQYEMTKWTRLGYSGAGIAEEVGRNVEGIRPGDRVAYAGEGHAEYISVPKHLCVRIPDGVSTREAAFVALGGIAMQAVRRAEVQMGEVVAVLGLGLVGQLVSQLLQAAGARVVGSDLYPQRLELAAQLGLEQGFPAGDELPEALMRYTNGVGVDRVVIAASTSSSQVVEQAVAASRDRGRIVVVGMVRLDVPCEEFYLKELDLVISRSYGPGRYDEKYEKQGIDYPIGYVRWTEQRNMQEFLRLIEAGKINVEQLVTHEWSLEEADRGYEQLRSNPAECLALLLKFDEDAAKPTRLVTVKESRPTAVPATGGVVAAIGCGGFARQFHLPNLKRNARLRFKTLVASTGQSAKEMAVRYGAEQGATDVAELWSDREVEAVMVFARDNKHADMVEAALESGKHVFCEKPLTTSDEQSQRVARLASQSDRICMTGFNRRFAPLLTQVKTVLDGCSGPKLMHYRVNAGALQPDDWIYDPIHSEGRIVGEACHFIDLFHYLTGAEPIRITASQLGEAKSATRLEDLSAIVELSDGSVANLLYTAQGSPLFPKERLEIFCDGTAIALDDYRRLTVRGAQRIDTRSRRIDKGHDLEFNHFVEAIQGNVAPLINYRDGLRATSCCLRLIESAQSGQPMDLDQSQWLNP